MVHPEDVHRFVLQWNFAETKYTAAKPSLIRSAGRDTAFTVRLLRQSGRHCWSPCEPDLMTIVPGKGSKVPVRSDS
jgi:hypothetical protein